MLWVLFSYEVKVTQSCPTLCNPMDYTVRGILQARILEWVAFPFSRGIFPTQGSKPGLPYCRQILYHLSHQGSPRILEWVAYPFSSGSSWLRNWTGVSCIAGGFSTNCAIREALYAEYIMRNAELEEAQAGIKIAGRNINNLRYADDTTLMAESWRGTKEPLDERGEWKSWLKAQHSES